VSGSLHIPLSQLAQRLREVPRDRSILVYCAGGYRSSIAASVMQRDGYVNVAEIAGGIAAWETAHLPVDA
jgi:rhodanese-related sulfurtransferase